MRVSSFVAAAFGIAVFASSVQAQNVSPGILRFTPCARSCGEAAHVGTAAADLPALRSGRI